MNPSNVTYTYNDFFADITSVFNTLSNHPWIALPQVSTTLNWNTTTYDAGTTGTPIFGGGSPLNFPAFIWDSSCGGPTGNAMNEFVFLRNRPLLIPAHNGLIHGFTSMVMDPATGKIHECDVILQAGDASGPNQTMRTHPFWPNPGPPTLGGPRNTTALVQEIMHLLGLDHTNLYPPSFAPSTVSFTPVPALQGGPGPYCGPGQPYPTSIAVNLGTGMPNEQMPVMLAVPARVSSNLNFVSYFTTNQHPDDITGIARIYPVFKYNPSTTPPKRAMINDTATIMGTVLHPNSGIGGFGRNVLLRPHQACGTTLSAGIVNHGRIAGTSRLGPTSILGLRDWAAGQQWGTGDFRIEGILAPAPGTSPQQYEVVVEGLESIGIVQFGPVVPFGEWFHHSCVNNHNPGGPSLNLWFPPYSFGCQYNGQTWRGSNDSVVPVGSLAVVPGTLITLSSKIQDSAAPGIENVSRPLIEVQPRALPIPPQGLSITVHHNANVTLVVRATINGAPFVPTQLTNAAPGPFGTCGMTSWVTTYSIPATAVPTGSHVVVSAIETGAGTPPRVQGFNEVWY